MRTVGWSRLLLGVLLLTLSAAAAAQNAVTNDSVSVYAGPDDSYPMVARLDADSPVQVMGCLGDWSWCDVTFADNRGWVYAPDIEYDYEGGYVPFYTYAPSFGVPVVQFTINEYWDRYYRGRPWYAEREEWAHREPPHHHRPAGPPPTAGPPPRSARVDRPSHDARREPPLRLGNAEGSAAGNAAGDAERARREADRPSHDTRPRDAGDARPREVKPPEMKQPPDMRQRSPETRSALEHPPAHVEPPRHEERASPPHQAEEGRHEETHRTEKTGEPPKDTPH